MFYVKVCAIGLLKREKGIERSFSDDNNFFKLRGLQVFRASV